MTHYLVIYTEKDSSFRNTQPVIAKSMKAAAKEIKESFDLDPDRLITVILIKNTKTFNFNDI